MRTGPRIEAAVARWRHAGVASVLAALLTAVASPAAADATLPMIDVHAHVFNLRYLPVRGILIARGVPKTVAETLDRLLVGATPLADLSRSADQLMAADLLDVAGMEQEEARRWVLGRLSTAQADARPGAELLSPRERRALRRYVEREAPASADRPPGWGSDLDLVEAALEAARFDERGDKSYPRFLATLMQNEVATVRLAMRDYPAVDLFVHHLMDMERPYDDRPPLDNARQIERLPRLATLFPGRLLAFVAFDPFRRAGALTAIRSALESRRALGVKFYPPSGYRADGNALARWPDRPSWWRFTLRAQWSARYAGWSGGDLDAVNDALFAFAAQHDLPILAHCTPDGFQAFDGSGAMSDPAFWRPVLARYPKLRLILAHAGGGGSWFSDVAWTGGADFDQRAWDLATRYENVYLDLSYSDELLDDARLAALRRRLVALLPRAADRPYALADKLVYGSDWHMVAALDGRREIFARLRALFAEPALAPYGARFFAGNAARALRLTEFTESAPLEPAQRDALRALLARIRAAESAR